MTIKNWIANNLKLIENDGKTHRNLENFAQDLGTSYRNKQKLESIINEIESHGQLYILNKNDIIHSKVSKSENVQISDRYFRRDRNFLLRQEKHLTNPRANIPKEVEESERYINQIQIQLNLNDHGWSKITAHRPSFWKRSKLVMDLFAEKFNNQEKTIEEMAILEIKRDEANGGFEQLIKYFHAAKKQPEYQESKIRLILISGLENEENFCVYHTLRHLGLPIEWYTYRIWNGNFELFTNNLINLKEK